VALEQDPLNHKKAPATEFFPGEIQQNDGYDTSNYENSPDQSTEEVVNVRVFSDVPFMAEDNELKAAGGTAISGSPHILFSFYPFLELDIQPHVFSDDVNFLESQGCFRVPTQPVLDEFMREYFLHVHPSLPIINERNVWEMYTHRAFNQSRSPRISLFVFQCMLFASCSVSLSCKICMGRILTQYPVSTLDNHSTAWIFEHTKCASNLLPTSKGKNILIQKLSPIY
jgi:hypothetical protein